MFGWINDCTECLVISKFGEETWHKIKETANCHVMDGGFLRYKYYPDSDTVELVVAASEVLGISVDDVLYAFGDYFIDYVKDNGYSNVLECLGSNLRDWLSNLNSLHDHLQASYPKGFVAPVFWSEDDVDSPSVYGGGSTTTNSVVSSGQTQTNTSNNTPAPENANAILVHYYSKRGSLLVPLVTGLIKKVAKEYFDIDINMELLQLQDEEQDLQNTTWRVTTTNPYESFKLRGKKKLNRNHHRRGLSNGDNGDDDTVTTSATSAIGGGATADQQNYSETFREGGTQAANLRVEEFVMRSFYNEDCELFHALTLEQYLYLIEYWKTNKINGDKWCYEIWSIQDDNKESWAKIDDLPYRLNPATIDESHFGGMIPCTGKYPPEVERGTLKSVPPKIRLQNQDKPDELYIDLTLIKSSTIMLHDAIYNSQEVIDSNITKFDKLKQDKIDNGKLTIECIVWNDMDNIPYHTFTLSDLETTSTLQLFELVPKTYDPIRIIISCSEIIEIDDDEEDL